jgi:hypothetical protein
MEYKVTGGQALAKYGPIVLAFALFIVVTCSLLLVDWWTP